MSFQYIHTSAKRGLEPGKSGLCCVARTRDTPPDLIQEFEQQSRFFQSAKSNAPTILRYRIAQLRSGKYHILTRIQDAGADYSKRNNHIAHHLAFTDGEIATLPNPASILLAWLKWRNEWAEPPRVLDMDDAFHLNHVNTKWSSKDSYGAFPPAIKYGEIQIRSFEISSGEETALTEHFRDSLKELRFKEQWNYPFTSALLTTDSPDDYIWRGAWNELNYPYEIDFHPKPMPKQPSHKPIEAKVEAEDAEIASPTAEPVDDPMKRAPTVEIPEAFDRKKRRRPKRKFGLREFSKSINYALLVSTLLCIGIAFFFYWNNQHDVETLIQEKRGLIPKSTLTPTEKATQTWQTFSSRNYPAKDLDALAAEANILAQIGDTQPTAIIEFLRLLRSDALPEWPQREIVPPQLLKQSQFPAATSLSLSDEDYPNLKELTLLPAVIADRIQSLETIVANPTRSFARQTNATYRPEAYAQDLRSYYQTTSQIILRLDAQASESMETFLAEKQAILANEKYQALLNIHRAFGLPDSAAFMAIDSEGRLSSPADTSYAAHLISLFTNHVLAHYGSIRNTSNFRAAFSRVDAKNFDTAFEASQAIYDAILVAEPLDEALRASWTHIRDAWIEAYVRTDLMEETIVSYTIEALENTKQSLATLQAQFSVEDLRARERLHSLSQEIDKIANLAQTVSKSEEWVVFDKQTDKVAPESP